MLTSTSPDGSGTKRECPFAIRSGGHAAEEGAANIDDGVTIDLRGLNTIELSNDKKTVAVGAGNTWDKVYNELDGLGLSVNGGRTAGVGVGGLSLGGGISWFSTRYGWTADTITNYEVVLANGSIINANKKQNKDLLWALRGGGNNFGIVSRVDVQTFKQEPFWGGFVYHAPSVWEDEIREFATINTANYDEYAHLTLTWSYSAAAGVAVANQLQYTKSGVDDVPPIFKNITSLPTTYASLGVQSASKHADDLKAQQAVGQRGLFVVNTLISTEEALKATYVRFNESLQAIEKTAGIIWSLTLEPLPPQLYARHAKDNALGLQSRKKPLVVVLLSASWTDETDDATIEQAARKLSADLEQDARKLNAFDPFLYYNYAAPWQNPIESYGAENVKRLRGIAKSVDPNGVFQKQVPGGFKLW